MASISANGSKGHHKFTLTLTEKSTDETYNTSTISFSFKLSSLGGNYDWSGWGSNISYTITIHNTKYTGTIPNYDGSSTVTLKSGTLPIDHEDDGSKVINYSFSVTDGAGQSYTCGNASKSGTMTLTTIPRATTPTLDKTSYEMGTTITINTPRASDSFTHDLYYKVGTSAKAQFATGVEDSFDWSNNLYLINWINNSTSATVTIYCETYNGDTLIGEKSVSFTGTVPSNIEPSIDSYTIEEYVTEVADKVGVFVKGKSRLSISVSASGDYNSTIVSYKITANGETFTSNEALTNILTSSGTQTINIIVTDSRGRSSVKGKTINVVDYYLPQANSISVDRCNSNGTLNENGEYLKATYTFDIAPINDLNSKNASIQYFEDDTWKTLTTFDYYSATNHTFTSNVKVFDTNSSYQIRLLVEDAFTSDIATDTLPTAFTLMNYHPSGTGMGIGKVAEKENTLDINLEVEMQKDLNVVGDIKIKNVSILDLIYPIGSIYLSVNSTNPSTLIGGTWEQIKDTFLLACGDKYENGSVGGEAEHTLTIDEMPSHRHGISRTSNSTTQTSQRNNVATSYTTTYELNESLSGFTGGGQSHNNMPPYLAVYIYKRVA